MKPLRRRHVIVSLGAIGLAALIGLPGTSPAADISFVHPLSEILESGPEYLNLTSTSVIVHIETKVPVVCAAVFGTTTAYGGLATDSAMGGIGQVSHHPLLSGLQPDTQYQMRLQGVGADGTLYVSDNYSFRTPAAPPPAPLPPGKNVALLSLGARVTGTSSNYGGGAMDSTFGGNNAIDGKPVTEWSSNGDGDKAWIEIDLGKPYALTAIGLRTRTMGASAQIQSFQLVADGKQTFGPFTLPDATAPYYFPVDTTARTLRFEVVKSSGGNTGVAEIDVFAK